MFSSNVLFLVTQSSEKGNPLSLGLYGETQLEGCKISEVVWSQVISFEMVGLFEMNMLKESLMFKKNTFSLDRLVFLEQIWHE